MGTRTIIECDRCKSEIKGATSRTPRTELSKRAYGGSKVVKFDICGPCTDKLDDFLSGTDLEEPP